MFARVGVTATTTATAAATISKFHPRGPLPYKCFLCAPVDTPTRYMLLMMIILFSPAGTSKLVNSDYHWLMMCYGGEATATVHATIWAVLVRTGKSEMTYTTLPLINYSGG